MSKYFSAENTINLPRFLMDRDGEAGAVDKIPKYISILSHLRWREIVLVDDVKM